MSPPARRLRWWWKGALPGLGMIAVVFCAHLARALVLPVNGWDGLSIWFFRAHQLFEDGRLSAADVASPAIAFTHFDHPLLVPGWLWAFAASSPEWSERAANVGLALLLAMTAAAVVLITGRVLGLVSAAGPGLWARHLHIPHGLDHIRWSEVLRDFAVRAQAVVGGTVDALRGFPILVEAVVAVSALALSLFL